MGQSRLDTRLGTRKTDRILSMLYMAREQPREDRKGVGDDPDVRATGRDIMIT